MQPYKWMSRTLHCIYTPKETYCNDYLVGNQGAHLLPVDDYSYEAHPSAYCSQARPVLLLYLH